MADHFSSSSDAAGKYFEILVPDYQASTARDAYLRLGEPATADTSEHGAALWGKFSEWLDQSVHGHTRDRAGHDLRPPLLGNADSPQGFWNELGWRDHTDGNRLTTTGGDKVEIIRGNYQLIVLGRGAEPDDGVIWDASGGHAWSADIAPGTVTKTEYKSAKFGGTWKVTEETTKGHVHEVFEGEFKEEFRGSKRISIVGTVPSALSADFAAEGTGTETGNPDILEGTWARSITEHVGSSASRVGAMTSNTYASSISETVDVNGDITQQTHAANVRETIGAADRPVSVVATHYGALTETQFGKVTESTFGAVTSTTVGWQTEFNVGGGLEATVGAKIELFGGGRLEVALAKTIAILIGMHTEVHLGSFREITIGYKWDLVIGWELEMEDYSTKIDKISRKSIAAAIFLG